MRPFFIPNPRSPGGVALGSLSRTTTMFPRAMFPNYLMPWPALHNDDKTGEGFNEHDIIPSHPLCRVQIYIYIYISIGPTSKFNPPASSCVPSRDEQWCLKGGERGGDPGIMYLYNTISRIYYLRAITVWCKCKPWNERITPLLLSEWDVNVRFDIFARNFFFLEKLSKPESFL